MEPTVVVELEQLERFVNSCADCWKIGYDAAGYEQFVCLLKQLASIIENHFDTLGERNEQLCSILDELYSCMRNIDIIAIGDVLEYELQPFIRTWKNGGEHV